MDKTQTILIICAVTIIAMIIISYYYQQNKINKEINKALGGQDNENNLEQDLVMTEFTQSELDLNSASSPINSQKIEMFIKKYQISLAKEYINPEFDYIALVNLPSENYIKILPTDVSYYKSTNTRAYALVNEQLALVNIDQIKIKTTKILFVTPMLQQKQLIDSITLHGLNQQLISYSKKLKAILYVSQFDTGLLQLSARFKGIEQLNYELELRIVLEKPISQVDLNKILTSNGLVNYNNYYVKPHDIEILFAVSGIGKSPIIQAQYNELIISSELSNLIDPTMGLNAICDFSNELNNTNSNRLVINSKVFVERDYASITNKIRQLQNKSKILGITLGGELLQRYRA